MTDAVGRHRPTEWPPWVARRAWARRATLSVTESDHWRPRVAPWFPQDAVDGAHERRLCLGVLRAHSAWGGKDFGARRRWRAVAVPGLGALPVCFGARLGPAPTHAEGEREVPKGVAPSVHSRGGAPSAPQHLGADDPSQSVLIEAQGSLSWGTPAYCELRAEEAREVPGTPKPCPQKAIPRDAGGASEATFASWVSRVSS